MNEHRLEVHTLVWRGIAIEVTCEAPGCRARDFIARAT